MTGLIRTLARLLLLPMLATAAALLVQGHAEPGGGFSAGIVAGTAVALQYVAFGRAAVAARFPVARAPALTLAGIGVLLALTFGPLLVGAAPLQHPAAKVELGMLVLDTAFLFEVGIALVTFGFTVGTTDELALSRDARGER